MINKKNLIIVAILLAVSCVSNIGMTTYYGKTAKELKATKNQITTIQNELENARYTNEELLESIDIMSSELDMVNMTMDELKGTEYNLVYLGDFKLTHYCNEQYEHICGDGDGLTATGAKTSVGTTIAVDPSVIPYGTKVYIEGYGWRVAQDCGGGVKQKQIDILVDTHSQALSIGSTSGGVWIVVEKS